MTRCFNFDHVDNHPLFSTVQPFLTTCHCSKRLLNSEHSSPRSVSPCVIGSASQNRLSPFTPQSPEPHAPFQTSIRTLPTTCRPFSPVLPHSHTTPAASWCAARRASSLEPACSIRAPRDPASSRLAAVAHTEKNWILVVCHLRVMAHVCLVREETSRGTGCGS